MQPVKEAATPRLALRPKAPIGAGRTSWRLGLLVLGAIAAVPSAGVAAPAGREWTPVVKLSAPGHSYVSPGRIELAPDGTPLLFANLVGGIEWEVAGYAWNDTAWVSTWEFGTEAAILWPVVSPPGTYHLIWKDFVPVGGNDFLSSLVMAEVPGGTSIAAPETVAIVAGGALSYSAAVGPGRRWAAVGDRNRVPPAGPDLRLLYSDSPSAWSEVEVSAIGEGVTVAALDDTTALMAWGSYLAAPGVGWGILRGSAWTDGSADPVFDNETLAAAPKLRPRPSGGQWLGVSTDRAYTAIATYRDGAWGPAESLHCAYLLADGHYTKSMHLSHDAGEYPVVSWSSDNARTGDQTVCVCIPTDDGFTVAENLANSEHGALPVAVRDRNGDVWVAWVDLLGFDGAFWTHTYVTASTSIPHVTSSGATRNVSWVLSEPAPETWWAVLRARTNQPYEEVARVRAGHTQEMSWTDPNPPPGALRYRIRRESVDARYLWESAPGFWPPPRFAYGNSPLRVAVGPRGIDVTELVFSAAPAGPLVVELYDLQGRRVHRTSLEATGSGRDVFELGPRSLGQATSPGVYFVRGRDAHERVSNAAKVVILR
jgi:hypothetical protein